MVEFCCISNSPSWLGSYLEELLVNITCRSSFRVHNKSVKIFTFRQTSFRILVVMVVVRVVVAWGQDGWEVKHI